MPIPTKNEVEKSSRYKSYFRGFRDGASGSSMRPSFTGKPAGDTLRNEYELGHADGYTALGNACHAAQQRIGYKPSVLRTAGA